MADEEFSEATLRKDTVFGTYFIPKKAAHRPAAKKVLEDGVWEPTTILGILTRAQGGDIVQAGAFFGDMLPLLSRATTNGATIWSFEPNFENYTCARAVVEQNGLRNVSLHHAGLGAKSGDGALRIVDKEGNPLGGASSFTHRPSAPTVSVPLIALDDLISEARRVGVIQLDVEGFETAALMGARGILARDKPDLIVETKPSEEWLSQNLKPLGYRFLGHVNINALYSARA